MSNTRNTTAGIAAEIAKGWQPNNYLTNMSMAYFQKPEDYVAHSIFPVCPVQLSASYYYTFSKEDLARDNVQIAALNYQRSRAPGVNDPRRAKVRTATEQMLLHQDILFAKNFFHAGVWANELTGTTNGSGSKEFVKFNDTSFDPIGFFDDLRTEIKRQGRRTPNRLALGIQAYNALKNNPFVKESVKYTGTTANPAIVTPNVLAQLFGVEQVKILESTYNSASLGQKENMEFICDPKAALLCYATPTPQIDEPSAGYIFTWDMLGNGASVAFDQYEGENGTHAEFIEGLCASDMKKTSDDLAIFLKDCV